MPDDAVSTDDELKNPFAETNGAPTVDSVVKALDMDLDEPLKVSTTFDEQCRTLI